MIRVSRFQTPEILRRPAKYSWFKRSNCCFNFLSIPFPVIPVMKPIVVAVESITETKSLRNLAVSTLGRTLVLDAPAA
jgi:hypothetical protein